MLPRIIHSVENPGQGREMAVIKENMNIEFSSPRDSYSVTQPDSG